MWGKQDDYCFPIDHSSPIDRRRHSHTRNDNRGGCSQYPGHQKRRLADDGVGDDDGDDCDGDDDDDVGDDFSNSRSSSRLLQAVVGSIVWCPGRSRLCRLVSRQ